MEINIMKQIKLFYNDKTVDNLTTDVNQWIKQNNSTIRVGSLEIQLKTNKYGAFILLTYEIN